MTFGIKALNILNKKTTLTIMTLNAERHSSFTLTLNVIVASVLKAIAYT
jgi:hypothetical protein